MKKLFNVSLSKINLWLIFGLSVLLLFFNSCKKEEKPESLFLSAKKWYMENNAKRTTLLKSNKNTSLEVTQEVQWDEANTTNLDDGTEILGVPVSMKLEDGSAKGSYMLLISRNGKSFKSQMAYNEKSNYFKSDFSTEEIEQLYKSLNKININRKLMTDEGGGGMSDEPQCTFWYLVETFWYSDGTVAYTTETYLYKTCSSTNGDGTGNGNGTGVVDCAGVVNGTAYRSVDCNTCMGGSTGITECPKAITNNVKDSCLKAQTDLALNAKTTIKDMLNRTFGGTVQFEDLDLEIRDTTNLPSQDDAQMQRLSGLAFEIRLNQNKLPNTSREYILSTVYHEILHAYMESKLTKGSNGKYINIDQHQEMATEYVTLITGALKIAFPTLGDNEAWALSWGGLEGTSFYTTKLTDAQRTLITSLNDKHKNKAAANKLGTYCKP